MRPLLSLLPLLFAGVTALRASQSRLPAMRRTGSRPGLSMGLKIYGNQGTRSPLVNWYCAEIGAPYEQIDATRVDRSSSDYPHPFGSIPAASDDGVDLFESGAILMFIADKYGGLDTPEKRATVGKWIMWANSSLDPICFLENERGQVIGTRLNDKPRAIVLLDSMLADSEWILGDEFTAADVAIASYLLYALLFNRGLVLADKYPNVAKYCARSASRPAYAEAFGADVASMLADRALAGGGAGGEKKGMFGIF